MSLVRLDVLGTAILARPVPLDKLSTTQTNTADTSYDHGTTKWGQTTNTRGTIIITTMSLSTKLLKCGITNYPQYSITYVNGDHHEYASSKTDAPRIRAWAHKNVDTWCRNHQIFTLSRRDGALSITYSLLRPWHVIPHRRKSNEP